MALTLSIAEGGKFYLNDTPVTMTRIVGDEHFVLEVDGQAFDVTGDKGTEIAPEVIVSAGNRPEWDGEVQVVITAPRKVRILREAIYVKENPGAAGRAVHRSSSQASGAFRL